MKKVIAVDFDRVIHDTDNPIKGRRMGAPIAGTKEALTRVDKKYDIVIHTIWKSTSFKAIADFMDYYDLPYDHITNVKPDAVAYIDDKAIRFTNWKDVEDQI